MKSVVLILSMLIVLPASANNAAYPFREIGRYEVMQMVVNEAQRQSVSPALALAVAEVESGFQVDALSAKGARGVMQIMPETGSSMYGLTTTQLFHPQSNIQTGIHFLKSLMDEYGRIDIALSHYNGGSRVRRPGGGLQVIPATRQYVNKVLEREAFYTSHDLVQSTPGNHAAQIAGNRAITDSTPTLLAMNAARRAQIVKELQDLQLRNSQRLVGKHSNLFSISLVESETNDFHSW